MFNDLSFILSRKSYRKLNYQTPVWINDLKFLKNTNSEWVTINETRRHQISSEREASEYNFQETTLLGHNSKQFGMKPNKKRQEHRNSIRRK